MSTISKESNSHKVHGKKKKGKNEKKRLPRLISKIVYQQIGNYSRLFSIYSSERVFFTIQDVDLDQKK